MASATVSDVGMTYRFLGDSGLLVSALGFGCMVQDESDADRAFALMAHAFQHGVNFFDTAEIYGAGSSERVVGAAIQRGIREGVWTREDLVVSTKLFFAPTPGPNSRGIGRKHLVEGTKGSLARLGLDYVDVIFAHRPEKFTPIEEVVRGMNFIINQGWAFYWGTSEWHEKDVLEACEVADRLKLIRPIVEQPEYNLLARTRVEVEFQALYSKYKLGLTTWSPLAFGMLTGKYAQGIPEKTRLSNAYFASLIGDVDARAAQVEQLRPIAAELGCSLAQLAIAWAVANSNVSSVLLGASSVEQLDENLRAFPVAAKITPEIKQRIESIVPFEYKASTYDGYYTLRQQYL